MVLYSIVLSSMISFKRSFGLTRSLFTLYVHEHDHQGFGLGLWDVNCGNSCNTFVYFIVPIATEKVSRIQSNII